MALTANACYKTLHFSSVLNKRIKAQQSTPFNKNLSKNIDHSIDAKAYKYQNIQYMYLLKAP